jgi:hypothetical protein
MPRNPKFKPNTKRIWIITEVVDGGRPGSTYVEADKARAEFDALVEELGYTRDHDFAYDADDADRNFVALDYVDIPA